MSGVVVSSGFVVNAGTDNLDGNSPIIGYDNRVTATNITATTEDPDYPVTNLANPSTALRWKSGAGSPTSEEYITVFPDTADDLDYLAIARHNFGSTQAAVSVEGVSEEPGSPADWFELVAPVLLPNDNPVIFRWVPRPLYGVRLRIQESLAVTPATPFLAVMYVGLLLLLQRRIYVGHTPQPYARKLSVANHMSVAGNFLGRIVLGEKTANNVSLKNLTPDWYRTYMEPFVLAAQEIPFFFSWRPGDYPLETGFCWLAGDPMPQNQLSNGMMQIDLDLEGTRT